MAFIEPGQFEAVKKLLRGRFEIRGDDRGNFDELVTQGGHVHFEMMDDGEMFIAFYPRMASGYSTKPQRRVTLWIRAVKGKLDVTVSDDE